MQGFAISLGLQSCTGVIQGDLKGQYLNNELVNEGHAVISLKRYGHELSRRAVRQILALLAI
jgi:hypothetical protein